MKKLYFFLMLLIATQGAAQECELPSIELGPNMVLCDKEVQTLTLPPGAYKSIQWKAPYFIPDGTTTVVLKLSGWYKVQVTSMQGCTSTDSVAVMIDATNFLVLGGKEDFLCYNTGNTISINGNNYISVKWKAPVPIPEGTLSFNARIAGVYKVVVVSNAGCPQSDSIAYIYADSSNLPMGCEIRAPFEQVVIPGWVEAEKYDLGAEGITYHDMDGSNTGGKFRTDGVDVDSSNNGGYVITTEPGEWTEYTFDVLQSGNYRVDFYVSSPKIDGDFHTSLFGNDGKQQAIALLNVHKTEEWTIVSWNLTLTQGTTVMRITSDVTGLKFDKVKFTFNDVTGVETDQRQNGISLFPNPFSHSATVRVNANPGSSIGVYSSSGALLQEYTMHAQTQEIGAALAPGVYTVKIYSAENTWVSKMVKLE